MIGCEYCKSWNKHENELLVGSCEKLKITTVNVNYCDYFKPNKEYLKKQEEYLSII